MYKKGNVYCTIHKNHMYLSQREKHVQEFFPKSGKVYEICGKDFRGNYELRSIKITNLLVQVYVAPK